MNVVELDGAYNVRDIGGLRTLAGGRTRHFLLYRGDSLDAISEKDEKLLFEKLKIGVVIDVRSRVEVDDTGLRSPTARYYQLPLIDDKSIGKLPFIHMSPEELADAYLADLHQGTAALRSIFEILAAHLINGTACIVHCAAGRDRTGAIMALLLASVGVRDEDIALDYVKSNRHADRIARRLASNPLYANGQTVDRRPVPASTETIAVLLRLVRRSYGTPAQFLLECGVAPVALRQLEAAVVDGPDPG
jgi:protein-tyrosine phosphatase